MSEQPYDDATQPRVPGSDAEPADSATVPRARSRSLRRIVLTFFSVVALLLIVPLFGLSLLAGLLGSSFEDSIKEVHYSGNRKSSDKVAIVTVEDVITDTTAKEVIKQLKKAKEDEQVKAVVLKVNTPGGTITASDHIYRRVKQLCRGLEDPKPVVVSMQSMAASGGYYLSVPAIKIFVEPTTLTGSIGVIASFPNVSGMMEDWKIRMEVIKTGPMKDAGSPFRPMTDQERERWSEIIGQAFDRFVGIVAEGRGMDQEEVRGLASGEIFTAQEAKDHKLVDAIGYLEDAIAEAERLANISDSHVVEYHRPLGLSRLLWEGMTTRKGLVRLDLNSLLRSNVPQVMYLTQAPKLGW